MQRLVHGRAEERAPEWWRGPAVCLEDRNRLIRFVVLTEHERDLLPALRAPWSLLELAPLSPREAGL